MATRSSIALVNTFDASISSVYCHWDGYLEHNGKILVEHYDNESAARQLLDHGDISVLARHIRPSSVDTHSFSKPERDVCVFYKRDRNDDNADASWFKNIRDWLDNSFAAIEFYYLGIPVSKEHGGFLHWLPPAQQDEHKRKGTTIEWLYRTDETTTWKYVSADLKAARMLASVTGYRGVE